MASRPQTPFLEAYGQMRRCITTVVDAAYGTLGLGATQAKLLRRIGESSHVSQADLARATGTDPALTGRALQTLLDRGWVQRRRSREDKRAFSLELSASGQALLREVLEAREGMVQRISACLSDDDIAAFNRIAKKLLQEFPESPRETPGDAKQPATRTTRSRRRAVKPVAGGP